MLNYLYLILIIAWVFLIVGLLMREVILYGLMSMVLIIVGLFMLTEGLGGNLNKATEVFAIVNIFTGLVFLLKEAFKVLED